MEKNERILKDLILVEFCDWYFSWISSKKFGENLHDGNVIFFSVAHGNIADDVNVLVLYTWCTSYMQGDIDWVVEIRLVDLHITEGQSPAYSTPWRITKSLFTTQLLTIYFFHNSLPLESEWLSDVKTTNNWTDLLTV
jgi:hypothetical protein